MNVEEFATMMISKASGLLAFASFTDLHCGLNSNLYHQH
jgi:hypothetical protein